jgi:Carboxypeptidase regulatory-like domain/TonB dependent receptor-like, beta-barrel
MGTPRRASNALLAFETPIVLIPALVVCVALGWTGEAAAQSAASPTRITQIATASTGSISGIVLDERGRPLDGVVVSALGTSSAFVVSDRLGQFTLRQLTPGPYLLRAHLQGYLPARNAMVNVRPSSRTVSSFTLHALGPAAAPRIAEAGIGGGTEVVAAPSDTPRDEGETAWRLRHLRRSILKDATSYVAATDTPSHNWFLTDSLYVVGRAVGSSAKAAGSLFGSLPLQGQVNLLTTGAFDNPFQLLQLERTRSVAYFAVGAPVALHGDWTVKAALNQGDLSSWLLTGNYARREPATHRYQFGMSYGVHRYEGGNLEAMVAVPEAARNVGIVYASDEWKIGKRVVLGYGGNYAHYDYLAQPAYVSPRVSTTIHATDSTRIHAMATRQVIAPGAEEFVPPAHAHVLPPQRTFAPLTRDGFAAEDLQHVELGIEEFINGITLGVGVFHQRVDNQLVTVFGMRTPETPPAQLGHYFIGSAGDYEIRGWTFSVSRQVAGYVRGSIDYSFAAADWTTNGRGADYWRLSHRLPSAIREGPERIHDLTTSVETIVPRTATRVFFVVKMNSAYIRADGSEDRPGLDGRFDMQLTQGLPFVGIFDSDWEMTVGVRNLFRDSLVEGSFYDELLVARPPKRLVGGITVRF